jgi:hypothetical protein
MNYKDEDKEDKKYKKGYGRKEFKKDVQEAVKPEFEKLKGKKKGKGKIKDVVSVPVGPKLKRGTRSSYAGMKVSELRKLLNGKKKALLTKSGFPDGVIPRSKDAMISLCLKLKRKRW